MCRLFIYSFVLLQIPVLLNFTKKSVTHFKYYLQSGQTVTTNRRKVNRVVIHQRTFVPCKIWWASHLKRWSSCRSYLSYWHRGLNTTSDSLITLLAWMIQTKWEKAELSLNMKIILSRVKHLFSDNCDMIKQKSISFLLKKICSRIIVIWSSRSRSHFSSNVCLLEWLCTHS